jgi:hypothetical protein
MAISNLLSLWSLVIQSTLEFVVQNWSLPSGFITEVLCKVKTKNHQKMA